MLKKITLLLLLVSLFGVACKRIVTKHKVYEFGEKSTPTPKPVPPMTAKPIGIIPPKTPETMPESKPATESKPMMVEAKPHVETQPTVESKPAKPPATHSPSAW